MNSEALMPPCLEDNGFVLARRPPFLFSKEPCRGEPWLARHNHGTFSGRPDGAPLPFVTFIGEMSSVTAIADIAAAERLW